MVLQRILSALIGIPLIIYLVYLGKLPFLVFIVVLTLLGLYELQQIMSKMELRVPPSLIYPCGVIYPLFVYLAPPGKVELYLMGVLTLVLLWHLVALLFNYPGYSFGDLASSYLGSAYLGVLFSYPILIRAMKPGGFYYMILVLFMTWGCDIGAYVCGRLLGKHALWKQVSPRKTWEGAIGGILVAAAVAIVLVYYLPSSLITREQALILALVVGVAVLIGDLVESAIKRLAGVKDAGEIIPGHGGVLDRFDSLLFSAPLAFFYLRFFL